MNEANNRYVWTKLALLLIILPIFIGLVCVIKFGVNVPYWDEWDIQTKTLKNYYEDSLSLNDLFSQHNESRPFFPRIVLLVIDLITNYNIVAEMIILFLIYCLSFLIIFLMFRKDNLGNKSYLWLFIPLSLYYFNFNHIFNNMLYGMFLLTGLMLSGFLGSVYLLDLSTEIDKKYLFALIAAIISSFSFIAGLTVWPVCLIQLILQKSNYKIKKVIIWIAFAITTFLVYYYKYEHPGHIPSLMESFYNPLQALLVFFSSFGLSIFRDPDLSPIAGILMLLFIAILILQKIINYQMLLKEDVKWISLILFSFIASAEISIGRTGLGLDNAISQRYFWEVFLNIIGLYCIVLNHIRVSNQNSSYLLRSKQHSKDMQQSNGYLLWLNLNYILFGAAIILLFLGSAAHSSEGIKDIYEIRQAKLDTFVRNYHLCHFEAMKTIDRVLGGGDVLINNSLQPRISVAAIAKRDLLAGHRIKKAIGSFELRGEAVNIRDQPDHIPIGLLQNARLKEDIRAGETVTFDRVSIPESLALQFWQKGAGI